MLRFSNLVDAINEWIGRILSPVVVLMMLAGTYEVVSRYIFNRPTRWAWELDQYLLCFFVGLGGAYTLLHEGHVKVDIVSSRLPARTRAILDLVTSLLLFLPFIGVMMWQGVDFSWSSVVARETSTTAWRPPIYPVKMVIPIAAFLMLLQGVAKFIRNFPIAFPRKAASQ